MQGQKKARPRNALARAATRCRKTCVREWTLVCAGKLVRDTTSKPSSAHARKPHGGIARHSDHNPRRFHRRHRRTAPPSHVGAQDTKYSKSAALTNRRTALLENWSKSRLY